MQADMEQLPARCFFFLQTFLGFQVYLGILERRWLKKIRVRWRKKWYVRWDGGMARALSIPG